MPADLRNLAEKLLLVAQEHPCYSQAHRIVANCVDHLCAMAGLEEAAQRQVQLEHELERTNETRNPK